MNSSFIIGWAAAIFWLWRQTRRVPLRLDEMTEDALKELYHLAREG